MLHGLLFRKLVGAELAKTDPKLLTFQSKCARLFHISKLLLNFLQSPINSDVGISRESCFSSSRRNSSLEVRVRLKSNPDKLSLRAHCPPAQYQRQFRSCPRHEAFVPRTTFAPGKADALCLSPFLDFFLVLCLNCSNPIDSCFCSKFSKALPTFFRHCSRFEAHSRAIQFLLRGTTFIYKLQQFFISCFLCKSVKLWLFISLGLAERIDPIMLGSFVTSKNFFQKDPSFAGLQSCSCRRPLR